MKKIIRYLLGIFLILILSSCTNSKPQELNNLIQTPKKDDIDIKGTWQVVEIKKEEASQGNEPIGLGDEVYIDNTLVGIGESYAYPPNFSSKYVNLAKYLKNRGFNTDNINQDEEAVIINASQGQLFSKDFIKISDSQMFFVLNNSIIVIARISDSIDSKIINEYSNKAASERITNAKGQEVEEDVSLILGVRERMENNVGENIYNYYTYLISVKDGQISYKKAYNIFVKDKEEYWSINLDSNNITDNYDQIISYPIRVRENLSDSKIKQTYTFKDINLNMRLNYASNDYLSIDYSSLANANPITKYAMLETKNIKDSKFLSLEEYTGEEDSDLIFKSRILEEARVNFDNIDEDNISFDHTNFGIVRDMGQWIFQSSVYSGDGDDFFQKFFPMEIAIGNQMINKANSKTSIGKDQVKNINTQAKDYYILQNDKYILIQTSDELLIHRIKDGLIEKSPIYSIPTINPTSIISIDEQAGKSGESLESAFTDYNEIIEDQR
ncbi:MAG: hypothetical protein Q4D88_02540 [Anaerococcus sp.]|nr:hypothetical protein [Anaerococcus sp.]